METAYFPDPNNDEVEWVIEYMAYPDEDWGGRPVAEIEILSVQNEEGQEIDDEMFIEHEEAMYQECYDDLERQEE